MSDDNEQKAEELLQGSATKTRVESEATTDKSEDDAKTLADEMSYWMQAADRGNLHENLTFRDKRMAALFEALENMDKLDTIAADAAAQLGRDQPENVTKSTAHKLLVRVALDEVAPDVMDQASEGYQKYLEEQADEI